MKVSNGIRVLRFGILSCLTEIYHQFHNICTEAAVCSLQSIIAVCLLSPAMMMMMMHGPFRTIEVSTRAATEDR